MVHNAIAVIVNITLIVYQENYQSIPPYFMTLVQAAKCISYSQLGPKI